MGNQRVHHVRTPFPLPVTAELQSVPSYRGKPHHAIARGRIITAAATTELEILGPWGTEILSRIIEFLRAFSRLAMFLLAGINIERWFAGARSRRKRVRLPRVSVIIPGNGPGNTGNAISSATTLDRIDRLNPAESIWNLNAALSIARSYWRRVRSQVNSELILEMFTGVRRTSNVFISL